MTLYLVRSSGFGEYRRVSVHSVEIRRVLHDSEFVVGEVGQARADDLLHVGRIVAEIDGVGEPAEVEVDSLLSSGSVYSESDFSFRII